jgi:hypothetical protein
MAETTARSVDMVDAKSRYAEGAAALRHYSLCVANLRMVTTAQGLIVLTGCGVLLQNGESAAAGLAALFGILFTGALYAMQRSYWICFNSILQAVIQLEGRTSNDDSRLAGLGPWTAYDLSRNAAYGASWWKILVKHGPYWLFWCACGLIVAVAILDLWIAK